MKSAGERGSARGAIAEDVKAAVATTTQSLELSERQSQEVKRRIDLGASSMDKCVQNNDSDMDGPLTDFGIDRGPTSHNQSVQNVSLSLQKVPGDDAEVGSFKDLSKTVSTPGSVTKDRDCYFSEVSTGNLTCIYSLSPGLTSLKEVNKNADMRSGDKLINDQRDGGNVNLEENMVQRDSGSNTSLATVDYDTTADVARTLDLTMQLALLNASQALEEQEDWEKSALIVISCCLEKVSCLHTNLKSSAAASFGSTVTFDNSDSSTGVINGAFRGSFQDFPNVDSLDSRLKTVDDYVRAAYISGFKQFFPLLSDLKVAQLTSIASSNTHSEPTTSTVLKKKARLTCGKSCHNTNKSYRIPEDKLRYSRMLRNMIEVDREARNAVAYQHQMLRKLCAVGEVYTSRIEMSCRTTLNLVKSVASVVRPALEATRRSQPAVPAAGQREETSTRGGGASPAERDVTTPSQWAHLALNDAEAAMRSHGEAVLLLGEARRLLLSLKVSENTGSEILRHCDAFEEYLQELSQQRRNFNFHELWDKKTGLASMRDEFPTIMDEMKQCLSIISELSKRSSKVVPDALHALALATQKACNAIQTSLNALTDLSVMKTVNSSQSLYKGMAFGDKKNRWCT